MSSMQSMQSVQRTHRGQVQDALRARPGGTNGVGAGERAASIAAGSILALLGMTRRSVPGMLVAGLGGAMISRGVIGRPLLGYGALHDALPARAAESEREIHLQEGFLIDRSPEALYHAWRDLENLPSILTHVRSVTVTDPRRSRWVVDAPRIAGGQVEWEAEITDDEPATRIGWRSLPGADVDNRGQVRFTALPNGRGTAVHVRLHYQPPGGRPADWIATILGRGARGQMREDLRHFKQRMETGEVPTIEGQPHGSCGGIGRRFAE